MTLLTGSTGFIGKHIKEEYPEMLSPTHAELDLTSKDAVNDYLRANKPEKIIHCASNDKDVCLYDNLRMFYNLAESGIPMITFCTGREIEDRSYKNGEYVFSKHLIKELALNKYKHIAVIQIWGCFGKHEKDIRFFKSNMLRIKQGLPILINEDRLFSYVYVNDLVKVVDELIPQRYLHKFVAYTFPFSYYAGVLAQITNASGATIENTNFNHSYTGKGNYYLPYTPLEVALKEMWEDINKDRR